MANTVDKVIEIALNEVGYLEKNNNAQLDNKETNAGDNNYTKYNRDYVSWGAGGTKSMQWCGAFVSWSFVKAYGLETAKELLCGGLYHYTPTGANRFKRKGQYIKRGTGAPKVGDVVFFYSKSKGRIGHTGIVYKVSDTTVYTVEGNTSSENTLIDNGGSVEKKSYKLTSTYIDGYGRPKYNMSNSSITRKYLQKGDNGDSVKTMQENLIFIGYSCGSYGADGDFGDETLKALKLFQKENKLAVDGLYGEKSKAKLDELVAEKKSVKTTVTYITHRIPDNSWGKEIVGYNLKNNMGYSGSFGKEIDKVTIKLSEGTITYCAHRLNDKWGNDITGYSKVDTNKYAGSAKKPIDAVAIKAEGINGKLKYRVHRKTDNKWGNWITGYSKTDINKYAGVLGKPIDAIQIGIE